MHLSLHSCLYPQNVQLHNVTPTTDNKKRLRKVQEKRMNWIGHRSRFPHLLHCRPNHPHPHPHPSPPLPIPLWRDRKSIDKASILLISFSCHTGAINHELSRTEYAQQSAFWNDSDSLCHLALNFSDFACFLLLFCFVFAFSVLMSLFLISARRQLLLRRMRDCCLPRMLLAGWL